jgi:phage N-6-adenine-methyltransferase
MSMRETDIVTPDRLAEANEAKPAHVMNVSGPATGLVRYDAMRRAIAEAYAVDEVKDIRDRAAALEYYARQAGDTEAERRCCEIRLRAERKAGQLLTDMPKDKGGRPEKNLSFDPTGFRDVKTLADLGVTRDQSSQWQKVATLPEEAFEEALNRLETPTTASLVALAERPHLARWGTGDNEWFTPVEYIERARRVLGEVDLDPASNALAQARVRAARFYTVEDDGLAHEWHGKIWLNPPYAPPDIELFIDKLLAELAAGRTTEAIMLTNNSTETRWFQKAAKAAPLICFICGRIAFESPTKKTNSSLQGQAFFYFGDNGDDFRREFEEIGAQPPPQTKGALAPRPSRPDTPLTEIRRRRPETS